MFSFLAQTPPPAPDAPAPDALVPASGSADGETPVEEGASFFMDIYQRVVDALMEKVNQFAAFLPDLIIAIVIIVIGLIVAKVVRSVLTKVFTKIKLDDILNKLGISQLFGKMGIQSGPSEFLPKLIYLVILLVIIQVAAQAAGIEDVSELIVKILAFSPRVVTAIIILLVGFIVAELVSNAVERALDNFGLDYAKTLAKLIFGFIFLLFLTVALPQLEIQTELLNATVKIMLGGLAVALALALGLGLKALAHDIVAGVYVRDLYKVGTEVEIEDGTATVAGVGPITTKLQRPDGGFVIVANHLLVSDTVRGRSAE